MYFFTTVPLVAVAAILMSLTLIRGYDYEEIKKLNASCFPKDTCSVHRNLDGVHLHNCDCSNSCVLYNSCCIDSPFLNINSKRERTASCKPVGQSGENIYMIDVCPSNYEGPTGVRMRCERTETNWSDPFNNVPVTNTKTMKTYKSLFCGMCNNEDVKKLVMWQIMLDCSLHIEICRENEDFVLKNMVYDREKDLWGLWSWHSSWKYRYLPMSYEMPSELMHSVKNCHADLISKCPDTWANEITKHLCEAYMGVVYFGDVAFRNIHCALCNGVKNFTSMSCHETTGTVLRSPIHSLSLLMDFNFMIGSAVGKNQRNCAENQIYDPFANKCRTIIYCIPGFPYKESECADQ